MVPFRAVIVREADGPVVLLSGEIDLSVVEQVRRTMSEALEHATDLLTVDLSGVDFMDSTGINTLVAAYRQLEEIDGRLVLRSPIPMIRKVLEISGLSRLVTVEDGAPDAAAGR